MAKQERANFTLSIICVDDEEGVLESYREVLLSESTKDLYADILTNQHEINQTDADSSDSKMDYTLFLAQSGEEAIEIVKREFKKETPVAAGFFDMRMPGGMDGYETVKRIKEIDPRFFCAIVTAFYDRNIHQIRRLFINDHQDELLYLKKPFSAVELRQTAFNMVSSWNRKRNEEQQIDKLIEANTRLKQEMEKREKAQRLYLKAKNEWEEAFNTINDAITIHDLNNKIVRANLAAVEMFNIPMEKLLQQKCHETYHGLNVVPEWCSCKKNTYSMEPVVKEYYEQHLNKYIEMKVLPRVDPNNKLIGLIHITRDISARKKAELEKERLRTELIHSQKMEVLGRLAGGVAHDFNNVLTPIIGYSELAEMKIPDGLPLKNDVTMIRESAMRAAEIVKQLLAFSRKQVLEVKTTSLNLIVENMAKMLERMIGEDILVNIHTNLTTNPVMVDVIQIEQVLMNLAVNARDAMPKGGEFTVHVKDTELSTKDAPLKGMAPGHYVLLQVSDTGEGIKPELLDTIFDPFFTTKASGKGTGLGLATVYGVVKQHNGYIKVKSEVGKGTTFKIYLPVSQGKKREELTEKVFRKIPRGSETVLLAEDDLPSLQLISSTLQQLGYTVLEARDGSIALEIGKSYPSKIDLLLTDVIMPGLNGRDLADKLLSVRPEIKIIFMSGYTADHLAQRGVENSKMIFQAKPILPSALATRIRSVLDK